MGFGFDFLIMVLLFFGNGATAGNDFLSLIPTDSYWNAKHVTVSLEQLENDAKPAKPATNVDALIKDLESPEFKIRDSARKQIIATGASAIPYLTAVEKSSDPEVAAAAIELVDELELHSKEQDIRRLMAIRTLGERKEKDALDELKGFTNAKELFVAEYAAQSIAEIEGQPFVRANHSREVARDLQLLPVASSVVAQCTGLNREPVTLDALIDASMEEMGAFMGQANAPAVPAHQDVMGWVTTALLKVAEQVGDIRFDGITASISQDAGEESGSAVVILRGQYDEQAALAAIRRFSIGDTAMKARREGGMDVLDDEENTVVLPSNQLFIVILGDTPSDRSVPRKSVLAALKAGDTGKIALAENKDLTALMATVDTNAPIWAVSKVTDEMRKERMLEPYQTLTLNSKITKEGTELTLSGEGLAEASIKGSAADIDGQIQTMITQGKAAAAQMKSLMPAVEFLESIKVTANGTKATMTGKMKNAVIRSILGGFGPMVIGPIVEEHQELVGPHP